MLKLLILFPILLSVHVLQDQKEVTEIVSFEGQQVTGVSLSDDGRIFANFPRWRETVQYSVVEVDQNGNYRPYPNETWNGWQPGDQIKDSLFIAVQSVVETDGYLYVLDTRNPLWQGVVSHPRIFVFDLQTDRFEDVFILSEESYKSNSYTNDLRIDTRRGFIYITDSNEPGLIVYDINKQKSRRVLDRHYSTTAEFNSL
ncbi:MAG: hypothetical protein GVY02_04665, partial [Bacteroidetes bacterium]|nr:hypothetical protein [Bacteroidota bacterium]